jgi:hypothetical protein
MRPQSLTAAFLLPGMRRISPYKSMANAHSPVTFHLLYSFGAVVVPGGQGSLSGRLEAEL